MEDTSLSDGSTSPLLAPSRNAGGRVADDGGHAEEARLSLGTVRKVCHLVAFARPSTGDGVMLATLLALVLSYMLLGNEVILAPGRVYNTLIEGDWPAFHAELRFFTMLLVSITTLRVLRGALTDALGIRLRRRLAAKVHAQYLRGATSLLAAQRPPLDNADQRAVMDARDFCDTLLGVLAGRAVEASGGLIEALLSVGWYTLQTQSRAGSRSVLLAFAWSAVAASASGLSVTYVARARVSSEAAEAQLRYAHAEMRSDAKSVAFEGAHRWRRVAVDALLHAAVAERWSILRAAVPLATIDHGFAYCVSIVMYAAIAFSITTGGSFASLTPGEKAKWISQTGGVFMQLLYAFTMLVALSAPLTRLVAQSHRVYELISVRPPADNVHAAKDAREIRLHALTVRLPDGRLTEPLTLRVQRGKRVLLAGRSGCGKTSALHALRGLRTIHSGTAQYPKGTEFLAQGARLPPGECSLRELVLYPALPAAVPAEAHAVRRALRAVGWKRGDEVDAVRDWSSMLSPGERQLVAVAGVVVRNAQFVVLDEPTSALDARSEELCMQALTQMGTTLLTVAHGERLHALHDCVVRMGEPSDRGA